MRFTFGETLEKAIKAKFKNQADFAMAVGVTQATISRYISGSTAPSFAVLQKMSSLLGVEFNGIPFLNPIENPSDKEIIQIPFYYSEVSAGSGTQGATGDFEYLSFDKHWLQNMFLLKNTKDLFSLKVKGDSMEPIISEGDIVFAKIHSEYSNTQGIYIVCYNDEYFIKKLQFKNKGIIKIISQNTDYDPIDVNLEDPDISFRIIGKIVGRISIKSFVTI